MERKEKKKKRTRIYTYVHTERIISTGFCITIAVTYTQKPPTTPTPPPIPVGWPVKQVVALRAPALGGGGGDRSDARRVLWRPKRGRRLSDTHGHRLQPWQFLVDDRIDWSSLTDVCSPLNVFVRDSRVCVVYMFFFL